MLLNDVVKDSKGEKKVKPGVVLYSGPWSDKS